MAAPSPSTAADHAMERANEEEQAAATAAAAVENGELNNISSSAADAEKERVVVVVDSTHRDVAAAPAASTGHVSVLQTPHPVAPIQVAPHGSSTPPYQTPPPQSVSLNSRKYTNRISLLLFLLHFAAASFGVGFFVFKAVQGLVPQSGTRNTRREHRLLRHWLPPIEASAVLSMLLAFAWQKAVRVWPAFMIRFILWSTFSTTMCAGVLLLCFSLPSTAAIGVALVAFSFGTGLYSCWVTRRAKFTAKVFAKALQPVDKFKGINGPAYVMMLAGFVWISLCCFAVIGAQNFDLPGLTVFGLVVSLMWTAEVMRNVANLTVSRVVALYYLRGMQCSIQFSFQRAASINLGSACLGSLFVPTIEACRILARGLNLLEGEDEIMFSCAHCCLHVMESVFHYGNSWAFVHVIISDHRDCYVVRRRASLSATWHNSIDSSIWEGVRGGVEEHMGAVREAEDGGARRLRHVELNVLPLRGVERSYMRDLCGFMDFHRSQALHCHRLPLRLLRRLSHDKNWDGAASCLRRVLLRVLCGESDPKALRHNNFRPAHPHADGPRRARADASLPPGEKLQPKATALSNSQLSPDPRLAHAQQEEEYLLHTTLKSTKAQKNTSSAHQT